MKVRVSPAHTTCLVLFLSLIFMSITTLKSTAQSDSVSSLSSTAELQANSSTIDVALKWERSKEEDTINGQSVGTNVMAGLQLPTYLDAVWEGGKCTPSVNRKAVPPGYKWASWPQKYPVDVRHFKATFALPFGIDPSTAVGVLYDPFYESDIVPINDNLYIYLNGVRKFFSGTSYGTANGGTGGTSQLANETDGWYIRNGIQISGLQNGLNIIDVIVEETNSWGGIGYLSLRFGPRLADYDSDGLPDTWEVNGATLDSGDGSGPHYIDLKAMGADPYRPDIFVQADWMQGLTGLPNRRPSAEALKIVHDAFADAPVRSPTGLTGINLHIDNGPDSIMDYKTNKTWGSLSQARKRDHVFVLSANDFNTKYLPSFISTGRASIFHYALFADEIGENGIPSGNTGVAPLSGSALIISIGSVEEDVRTILGISIEHQQAGTLMHELGHNLGLDHGGGDGYNHKPNYLSVMNYSFQLEGLTKLDASGRVHSGVYDYSRAELPDLQENSLIEVVGLNGEEASNGFGTKHYCPRNGAFDVRSELHNPVYPANGPIDWNCSATFFLDDGIDYNTTVPADINGDGQITTLHGYNDWGYIAFKGGGIGRYGVPVDISGDFQQKVELTLEEALKSPPIEWVERTRAFLPLVRR